MRRNYLPAEIRTAFRDVDVYDEVRIERADGADDRSDGGAVVEIRSGGSIVARVGPFVSFPFAVAAVAAAVVADAEPSIAVAALAPRCRNGHTADDPATNGECCADAGFLEP